VRLDTSGNVRWQKAYGGSLEDFGFGVVTAPDGGFAGPGLLPSLLPARRRPPPKPRQRRVCAPPLR